MIVAKVAPPYSLVRVEDPRGGIIADPEKLRDSSIVATDSCIAITVQYGYDGDIELTLGPGREVDPGSPPAFQGELETPTGQVAVRSVPLETILEHPASKPVTQIRVWTNHPREPDKVIIGID